MKKILATLAVVLTASLVFAETDAKALRQISRISNGRQRLRNPQISGVLRVDTINEFTEGDGVTIETIQLIDGAIISPAGVTNIYPNLIVTNDLVVSNNVTIGGTLDVDGTATFTTGVDINGDSTSTNMTFDDGSVIDADDSTFGLDNGTFNGTNVTWNIADAIINGSVDFNNGVTINGNLNCTNIIVTDGAFLDLDGSTFRLDNGSVNATGTTWTLDGGTMTIASIDASAAITGDSITSRIFRANDSVLIMSNLSVVGRIACDSAVTGLTLVADDSLTVGTNALIGGTLGVSGVSTFTNIIVNDGSTVDMDNLTSFGFDNTVVNATGTTWNVEGGSMTGGAFAINANITLDGAWFDVNCTINSTNITMGLGSVLSSPLISNDTSEIVASNLTLFGAVVMDNITSLGLDNTTVNGTGVTWNIQSAAIDYGIATSDGTNTYQNGLLEVDSSSAGLRIGAPAGLGWEWSTIGGGAVLQLGNDFARTGGVVRVAFSSNSLGAQVAVDAKYVITGVDATTGLMAQSDSDTITAGGAVTGTFAVVFGAAPLPLGAVYTSSSDGTPLYITGVTASNYVATGSAADTFRTGWLGTRP